MTDEFDNLADRKALEASAHERIDELLYAESLAGKYLCLLTLISGALSATVDGKGNGMTEEEMRAYIAGIEMQITSAPGRVANTAAHMLLAAKMGAES